MRIDALRNNGTGLIEVLTVLMVLPVILLIFARVFVVCGNEIPDGYRLVQEQATVRYLISRLRKDMDRAADLPLALNAWHQDPNTLIITQPDRTVVYERMAQQVRIHILEDGEPYVREFHLPRANITWNPWPDAQHPTAVKVHTSLQSHIRRRLAPKQAGTHLLYMGILSGAERL